jgi:hypothetical protein
MPAAAISPLIDAVNRGDAAALVRALAAARISKRATATPVPR